MAQCEQAVVSPVCRTVSLNGLACMRGVVTVRAGVSVPGHGSQGFWWGPLQHDIVVKSSGLLNWRSRFDTSLL